MALRAFHANPSIGGFGGESTSTVLLLDPKGRNNKQQPLPPQQNSDGDALCQIVKELVDNAVDACEAIRTEEQEEQEREEQEETPTNKKCLRVKVGIVPYNTTTTTDDNKKGNPDILQVTISDNGCGMADIQNCVDAFQSSKNGGGDTRTAGRYGIGLTLCLLHAQRLVPNSYACITSATKEQRNFTRALYVVDTQGDSVECHQQVEIPKTHNDESGTCVSLLVPVSFTGVGEGMLLLSFPPSLPLFPVVFLPSSISTYWIPPETFTTSTSYREEPRLSWLGLDWPTTLPGSG